LASAHVSCDAFIFRAKKQPLRSRFQGKQGETNGSDLSSGWLSGVFFRLRTSGDTMLKFCSLLLFAAALPALADAPASTSAPSKNFYNFAPPAKNCYFIRQANRQLQAPQDKPGFMPLAGVEKLAVAPFENCMSEQRTIKTILKTK
jgi:hypothetical protein